MPKTPKNEAQHRLTPRRLQILTFIRDFQRSKGYSPSLQELGEELGVARVTVFEHVEALVATGHLRRTRHKARSLELTSLAQFPDESPTLIPIAGRIAAGCPIEAIETDDVLDLKNLFATRGERFILEVRGDSMIDDQIRDGDMVVAEKRSEIRDGDIVVAVLPNGEATLKGFYREPDRIRLQPANPDFDPIYVTDVDIQGVVIGVIRQY